MKLSHALSLIGFFALVPALASGQKGYAIGVGGGAAIPVGRLRDLQNTGYSAEVVLAVGSPDSQFGVRFDGIYNNLTRAAGPAGAQSADFRVYGALLNFVYAFPGTYAKPYLLAGAGWYGSKVDTTAAKSQSNLGFSAGLGITFGFGPAAGFLESRYHSISRTVAKGGVYQFVPVTFGLMF